jgi:hypothetical protein
VAEERERLWQRWRDLDERLDGFAARRPRETAVVVLEPSAPADERPRSELPLYATRVVRSRSPAPAVPK